MDVRRFWDIFDIGGGVFAFSCSGVGIVTRHVFWDVQYLEEGLTLFGFSPGNSQSRNDTELISLYVCRSCENLFANGEMSDVVSCTTEDCPRGMIVLPFQPSNSVCFRHAWKQRRIPPGYSSLNASINTRTLHLLNFRSGSPMQWQWFWLLYFCVQFSSVIISHTFLVAFR